MRTDIYKYPRTRHIVGSNLQKSDHDLKQVPFSDIKGKHLVVEEKIDGANSGISFYHGQLQIQSRGHYLTGGRREAQFALLKTWAMTLRDDLEIVLEDRYVMYGEWMYNKHTIYYDRLPHYFMEFDILDTQTGQFLSTARRKKMLREIPVCHAPVVAEGSFDSIGELMALIKPSLYKSADWRNTMKRVCEQKSIDFNRLWEKHTDQSDLAEGLYIKHEENGQVVGRYKIVRQGFISQIVNGEEHVDDLPICPNMLAEGVDIFQWSGK